MKLEDRQAAFKQYIFSNGDSMPAMELFSACYRNKFSSGYPAGYSVKESYQYWLDKIAEVGLTLKFLECEEFYKAKYNKEGR